MKKLVSVLLTFSIMLVGMISLSIAPAQANQPGSVTICHANSGSKEYTQNTVNKNSIVEKNGHSAHDGDIIPPFEYKVANREGSQTKYFPGKNWKSGGTSEAFVNNGCKTPIIPVVAVPPTFEPATCENLSGKVNLSQQPEGVRIEGVKPVREGDKWRVTYDNVTDINKYKLDPNPTNFFVTINAISTDDPLWDAVAGECLLPATGASTGTTLTFLGAGALILLLGGLAVFGSRRKKSSD